MSNSLKGKILVQLRRLVYCSLGILGRIWYRLSPYPVVLCYHSINEDRWFHGVSLRVLELQLTWLRSFARPVTMDDIYKHITGKVPITTPAFAVNFDDGYSSILSAKPLLDKLNIKPTFFVLSDPSKASHAELDANYEFLTDSQIRSLIRSGWTLGSHSATHRDFWGLSEHDMKLEIHESKLELEKRFNVNVKYIAYPRGRYSDKVLEFVRAAGYLMALSMDDGIISKGQNPYTIPRTGINRTHSFSEFKSSFPPTAIYLRRFIKKVIGDVF